MSPAHVLLGFVTTQYFCVPFNPELATLRSTIDDRLYKIRHCLDINGNPVKLSHWDASLGPGSTLAAGGLSSSQLTHLNDTDSLLPNYRFVNLLQKCV